MTEPNGNPMGRPPLLKAPSPVPVDPDKPDGPKLSFADAIYQSMRTSGLSAPRCAQIVGLPRQTVSLWLMEGRKASERQARGAHLTVAEERHADFFNGTGQAHAEWIRDQQELHHSVAAGGITVTETEVEVDPTEMVRDVEHGRVVERPKILKRRIRSKTTLPDARAIEWELERLARSGDPERHRDGVAVDDYATRVEITGADGGPIEVGSLSDEASRLAAEAEAFVAGAAEASSPWEEGR